LHRIKIELEDLCLRYLKPDIYAQLNEEVVKHHTAGQDYIDEVIELLGAMMEKNGIQGRTFGRTKHLYSTYTKMQQQGLSLDEVYDLIAFRVVVGSLKDCYAVLGLVHSMWKPVPGRFKDYISTPKANMYQSLHTTVIGPDGERIEIQIRTEEMHRVAEYGVAAHWQYKEKGKGPGRKSQQTATRDAERYTWLKQIMDWQREFSDAREFMAQLRFDLFQEEVYVFTPAGDVKELPEGATPVDFAYAIHTEVGDHCAGAKVNGKLVPLSTKLQNGDTIEIITDPHRRPSRDWLKYVKTAKARTRITHYIRTEERAESIALGKEMLEKEGRKIGVNVAKAIKDQRFEELAREFSFKGADDVFSAVGYARMTPGKVFNKLAAMLEGERPEPPRPEPQAEAAPEAEKARPPASGDSIKLSGVDNVLVHFASCCNPLPGEPIVGYITRGRGVTVHRTDCVNIKNFEPERLLNITWEGQEDHPYPADIRIICANERGMLAKISTMLNEEGINIDSGHFASNVDGNSQLDFTVEVKDLNQLYNALAKVKSIRQVREAVRMS
jgi:GTP pyrophosphokinase